MSKYKEYVCIEFNGLALNPSFSIYLFEIKKGENKFFYVGMTGDSHYPSARSILHRLSGHIDLSKRSTQNQFIKALKEEVFKSENINQEQLRQLNIKLHQYPIPGFQLWNGGYKKIDKNLEEYKRYKAIQQKVLNLEKKIIGKFKGKLLNRTKGNSNIELDDILFKSIYENIDKILNG